MKTNSGNLAEERVDQWYNQIRSENSLTEYDSCLLKDHLLDTIDELKASGLDEAEAFEIAAMRIGNNFDFEEEYARINSDALLIRKIMLILSGIMTYFLVYYLMNVSSRIIIYYSHTFIEPAVLSRYIINYLIGYHIIFVILTFFIYTGKVLLKKILILNINPVHIILLVSFVFCLALTDFRLQQIIVDDLPRSYLLIIRYFSIFDFSGYSFPFLIGVCFLILFRTINLLVDKELIALENKFKSENKKKEMNARVKMEYCDQLEELIRIGLDEEEAIAVVMKRKDILPENDEKEGSIINVRRPMKTVLIVLAGVLVYLFLYYFLHLTIFIFLTILQHLNNDPVKNFGWTKWYIATFNLIPIFFTTSLYIKDKNLMLRLKKLCFSLFRISMIFFTTILLAIVDRLSLFDARKSLGNIFELKLKLLKIMDFSDLSFSFVILMCFLVLFNKYYRENMKTH